MKDAEAPPAPPNPSFSRDLPSLQIAWDSTSIGALKLCPEYYNLTIRQGYTTGSENVHLRFGILFHEALELYQRLKARGNADHDAMIVSVIRHLILSTWNADSRRPWTTDEPTKNRETLVRSAIWYLDNFRDDPIQTYIRHDGKPAVEVHFSFDSGLRASTGEAFILCGYIDRKGWFQDKVWTIDYKTTKGALTQSYFARYSPDNQVSTYDFAGAVIDPEPVEGVVIDAMQTLVGGSRFQRQPIARKASQREEWHRDLAYWLAAADRYAQDSYWPHNDRACGVPRENPITGETEYGCSFREVCGSPPEVRSYYLRGNFTRRQWNPLATREKD